MNQILKVTCFILITALSSFANAVIISASDTGWYSNSSERPHNPDNDNYITGYHNIYDAEYRNFMVFDLSSIGTIESAVLRAYLIGPEAGRNGYNSQDTFESWDLREITTSVTELTSGTAPDSLVVFDDLGSGTLFGTVNVSAGDMGSYVEVVLNAEAISAISSASSGLWAIGGSISTLLFGDSSELVFSRSQSDARIELVLNEVLEVPAPAGLGLILMIVGFYFVRRSNI